MGVSLKDIKMVSAIVNYVMTLQKHRRMIPALAERHKQLPHALKLALKHFSKSLRKEVNAFFEKDWNEEIDNNKFEELNLILRSSMDRDRFPFVEFVKFCYQISELAACSYRKGLEPASKLAEHYILEVIKYYRSKRKFNDHDWTLMTDAVYQYVLKNDMF